VAALRVRGEPEGGGVFDLPDGRTGDRDGLSALLSRGLSDDVERPEEVVPAMQERGGGQLHGQTNLRAVPAVQPQDAAQGHLTSGGKTMRPLHFCLLGTLIVFDLYATVGVLNYNNVKE
jgi:hypothetical protein